MITTEKAIPVTIETYWMLRDKREQMSKNLDKHVTFDEVIRSLIEYQKEEDRKNEVVNEVVKK